MWEPYSIHVVGPRECPGFFIGGKNEGPKIEAEGQKWRRGFLGMVQQAPPAS